MSPNVPDNAPILITIDSLATTGAISAIGLVAARTLQQHGIVTFQVSEGGSIELVPDCELELDHLNEQEALLVLIKQGYTDTQLSDFLRMRQVRRNRRLQSSSQDDHR